MEMVVPLLRCGLGIRVRKEIGETDDSVKPFQHSTRLETTLPKNNVKNSPDGSISFSR